MSQSMEPPRRDAIESIASPIIHVCEAGSWLACQAGNPTDLATPPSIRSSDLSLDAPSVLILFDHDQRSAP